MPDQDDQPLSQQEAREKATREHQGAAFRHKAEGIIKAHYRTGARPIPDEQPQAPSPPETKE